MELMQEFIASPYNASGLVLDWPSVPCSGKGVCWPWFLPVSWMPARCQQVRPGLWICPCQRRRKMVPSSPWMLFACGLFCEGGLLHQPVRPGDFACGGCSFCPSLRGPCFCNGLDRCRGRGAPGLLLSCRFRPTLSVLWRQRENRPQRPRGTPRPSWPSRLAIWSTILALTQVQDLSARQTGRLPHFRCPPKMCPHLQGPPPELRVDVWTRRQASLSSPMARARR